MTVSIFFSTGPTPEPDRDYDYAIGLAPTPLPLKVHHNLGLLSAAPLPVPAAVRAFLVASLGVWAADKATPRQQAPDAWTRRLRLSLPSAAPGPALPKLAALLRFLTGDDWILVPGPSGPDLDLPHKPGDAWRSEVVCLFSGGVDSLAGAIDLLAAGKKVLLVSHYDFGQLAGCQNLLLDELTRQYGPEQVRRWGFRIQFEAPELSLRSRSLLFIALGLAAASVWGPEVPLTIPENGWISLNPPLTGSRLGSYSTRTTHPYVLDGLKQILAVAGIGHDLNNPYQYLTKGEILARSRNPDLLRALLPHTISCAHPVASRWQKHRQGNCGYCFPCLMRRAALAAIGQDDGQDYLCDALQQPEVLASRARGADLRSLLYLLDRWRREPNPQSLLWQTGPLLGEREKKERLVAIVERGLAEMSLLLEARGGEFLQKFSGLTTH